MAENNQSGGFLGMGNGVPVDVEISLNTKTYVYLGGTIVAAILVGTMLSRLITKFS